MPILNFVILLFLFLATNVNHAFAEECILAEDMGDNFRVVVPARPSLSHDGGFSQGATSQRAVWTDSGLFTSGSGNYYFEIEGMWTPWYGSSKDVNGKSMMASKDALCYLAIENFESEEMGVTGEFDYITSSYYVRKNGDGNNVSYEKYDLDSSVQIPCWLTAGEGLYIAFFGKSGEEEPQVATHLKSAVIKCDDQYRTDKNDDGIFTLDECYDINDSEKKNMAYYAPYYSGLISGKARCKKDNYHPMGLNICTDCLGINECYADVEIQGENDNEKTKTVREDRTIFTYSISNFYKTPSKKTVGMEERVKFIIYDKYYGDNVGQYVINIFSGLTDLSDRGLIHKILTDLEEVFIGNRDDKGNLNGGILQQFYNYIVGDTTFALTLRSFIILYMAFLGLQFAMGSLEYKTKELMQILLKLAFILGFTTATSWKMYDRYIVSFFFDGFSSIITMIANIASRLYEVAGISGGDVSSKFAFIDTLILSLFSDSVTKKIQGLFFGVWFGFIVIPIMYGLIIYYVYKLVNAIFPYIIMFIQAVLALAVGPIFISFYLFKTTEYMFKNWLAFVGARFANMAFLFLFLFSFASIIKAKFMDLLYFDVCKIPLWQAVVGDSSTNVSKVMSFFSFGIKVWDARWSNKHPEPSFFGFCVDLLFLFILIWLFGVIMKKVPSVVDSVIDIGGEGGGKNKDLLGKNSSTFTEAIDSDIKISAPNAKGEMQSVGLFKGAGMYVKKGAKWTREHTFGAVGKAIKNSFSADMNTLNNIDAINENGSVGIKMAADKYKKKLMSGGMAADKADAMAQKYAEKLENRYAKKPIERHMRHVLNSFEAEFQKAAQNNPNISFDGKEFDGMMKTVMADYVRNRFGEDSVEPFRKFYEKSPMAAAFRTGMVGKGSKDGAKFDTEGFAREFMVRDALGRVGLKSTGDFKEDYNLYQKSVAGKINKGTFGKNNKSKDGSTQLSGSSRRNEGIRYSKESGYVTYDTTKEGLTKSAEALKRSVLASFQRQYEKERGKRFAKQITDNRTALQSALEKLEQQRLQSRDEKISAELDRLKRLQQQSFAQSSPDVSNRIQAQITALEAEKARNTKLMELRSQLNEARKDENGGQKFKDTMKAIRELGPDRYGKLAAESNGISSAYAAAAGETHASSLKYDGLYKAGEGDSIVLNKDAIAAETERLKGLLSNEDLDTATRKEIEETIDKLAALPESTTLKEANYDVLSDIQKIDDKVLGDSDVLSRLDTGDEKLSTLTDEVSKYQSEYREIMADEEKFREGMNEQLAELHSYKQDGKGEIVAETGNKNMVLEGLDAATFGGEGIAGDLGIGSSSVEELLGFGDGAGSLIMGKDFIAEDAAKKANTDEDILNRARLKMSKQQVKMLKFQLAQAEAAGADPKEIQRIKDELKDNERQVKIIEDDIQESQQ